MTDPHVLALLWQQWCDGQGVDSEGPAAQAASAELVSRHAEPHRRYHTADHVEAVVRTVHRLADTLADPSLDLDAIVAAALFHDLIYDPRAADNERRSAARAGHHLTALGWLTERVESVARMIEATATHEATNDACAVLLDADLAVLGAAPAHYAAYVEAVRTEYDFVGDDAWRAGRASVLRSFLSRDHIYVTATMRLEREDAARRNLAAELAELASRD